MNEPTEKPKKTLTPRLRDVEHETVSVRLPTVQVQWLEEEARRGFRGRSDMLALIVSQAYLQAKESEG